MRTLDAILSFFFLIALIAGCSSAARFQREYGTKYRYYYSMTSPVQSDSLFFRDDRLIIQFRFDDAAVSFQLQNISPFELQIDWRNASYGIADRNFLVRKSVNDFDSLSTVPTTSLLSPLGVLRDALSPQWGYAAERGEENTWELLPTTDGNDPARRDSILGLVGTTVRISLPIECGPETRAYHFVFAVDSVVERSWSDVRSPVRSSRTFSTALLGPDKKDLMTAAILVAAFVGFSVYMWTAKKTPVSE